MKKNHFSISRFVIFCSIVFTITFCFIQCKSNDEVQLVSSGKIERFENFKSNFVLPRNIDVWLPEDYSSDKKYAVLYMHDGQMLFDSTTTWNHQEWGVDETITLLTKDNKINNTIVVGIWNTDRRYSEYFPQKPFETLPLDVQDSLIKFGVRNSTSPLFKDKIMSDNYLKFLTSELKPFIDKTYSTKTDVANTFIAGSSMGGLISIYAICEYPYIFGGAACLSTHWVGTFETKNNPIPPAFNLYLNQYLPDPKDHKIYFDYGTATLDSLYEPYQLIVDSIMIGKGYSSQNWQTNKFEGDDHSERSWRKRFDRPMLFLLKNNE